MDVSYSLGAIRYDRNSVVSVGTFDGVHRGHQAILAEVSRRAKQMNGRGIVVTFDPHPREIVGRGPVEYLLPIEERLELIERQGIDEAVVLKFTYEFSRQSSREFYTEYIARGIGVKEVVVGHDHQFGRDREAGIDELGNIARELGFTVHQVEPVVVEGRVVSSSSIREFLRSGDVVSAQDALGYPYALKGTVVEGDRRGRELGYPTANIELAFGKKLIPALGVYFVVVRWKEQQLYGMMNIGVRPTFETDRRKVIEVHMFDLDADLYGQELSVKFLRRIRPEMKFSSKDELVAQIKNDHRECMKYVQELYQS
jgi:riboflavin kinase/FMN adenylyltransferase